MTLSDNSKATLKIASSCNGLVEAALQNLRARQTSGDSRMMVDSRPDRLYCTSELGGWKALVQGAHA